MQDNKQPELPPENQQNNPADKSDQTYQQELSAQDEEKIRRSLQQLGYIE